MDCFVIDTNFFVNLQRSIDLGKNKKEVVANFIKLSSPLITNNNIKLITTPGALKEIESFFEDQKPIQDLLKILTINSPSLNELSFSAVLFFDLVEEIGKRLYRGLRIAEEPIKQMVSQTNPKKELARIYIKELRDKYRRATREGFLDSTIDLELILLAKQTNAVIVTSDKGLLTWARKFGCQEILPENFVGKLKELLKTSDSA